MDRLVAENLVNEVLT